MSLALSFAAIAFFTIVPGWLILQRAPKLRDALSRAERLAVSVALSVILMVGGGLALARLDIFSLGPVIAVYAAVIATGAFLSRETLLEWLRGLTRRRVRLPNSLAEWASITIPMIAVVAIMNLYLGNAFNGIKARPSGWRYMADVTLLLEEGGIPETSFQFGVERPWALSKVGGSIWLGSVRLLSGLSELDAMQYVPILFLAVAMLGSWVLLRLFLGRIAASAGLLLLFANLTLVPLTLDKFSRLTIEGVALSLAPLMLWALVKADRDRIPQLRWLAFALLVLIGITHGVVFLMSLTAVGAYLTVRFLSRTVSLKSLARDVAVYAVFPVLIVLSGLLVGSEVEILSGVRSESAYQLVDGVGDPTRALSVVKNGGSIHSVGPPREGLSPSPGRLFKEMAPRAFSDSTELGRLLIDNRYLTYAAVVAMAVAGFALARSLRWAFAAALIFIVGIYVIAVLFTVRYDLWIFTIHSLRREYNYISFGTLAVGLLFGAWLLRGPWLRNAAHRILMASLLTIAPIGLFIETELTDADWRRGYLGANLSQTFEWLRDNTQEDSVILSNVRSAGIFELYAKRASLTEGQVPYLFPDQLDQTLTRLDRAQGWFSNPDLAFLRAQRVDYIVAIRTEPGGGVIGQAYAAVKNPRAFEEFDFLRVTADFGRAVVYKVVSPRPPSGEEARSPP